MATERDDALQTLPGKFDLVKKITALRQENPNIRILDIGCSGSLYGPLIGKYDGVDVYPTRQTRSENMTYISGDAREWFTHGKYDELPEPVYDVIILAHVFEFLGTTCYGMTPDMNVALGKEKALAEIMAALKPGGTLFVITPIGVHDDFYALAGKFTQYTREEVLRMLTDRFEQKSVFTYVHDRKSDSYKPPEFLDRVVHLSTVTHESDKAGAYIAGVFVRDDRAFFPPQEPAKVTVQTTTSGEVDWDAEQLRKATEVSTGVRKTTRSK